MADTSIKALLKAGYKIIKKCDDGGYILLDPKSGMKEKWIRYVTCQTPFNGEYIRENDLPF